MTTYWDFRQILDVHPEDDYQCVAIKLNQEERCEIGMDGGKFMNRENLKTAATLLNTMDQTESLNDCRGYLNRLASLTMCGSPHRNMENVRNDRCRRWNRTISAYSVQEERRKAYAKPLDTERKEIVPSNEECPGVEQYPSSIS